MQKPLIMLFSTALLSVFIFANAAAKIERSANPPQNNKLSAMKWESIRVSRENEIKRHLTANAEGFSTFINGSIGQGPIPLLVFALLPDLFPNIWGQPNEHMRQIGLTENKYFSNHGLPLGIGSELVSLEKVIGDAGKNRQLNMAGFNCVACHAGSVETAPGITKTILAAPNTRINNVLFLFARTVTNPDFNADSILTYLKSKPLGSIYGFSLEDQNLEALDRKVFMEEGIAQALVESMRARGQGILGGFERFIRPRTYDAPGQHSPDPYAIKRGSMDAFLPLHLSFVSIFSANPFMLESELPKHTSETDVPSIWQQRIRGPVAHWDGNHISPLHRNIGAAAAGLNNPVNIQNVQLITDFLQEFPAEVYPFDVDLIKANRGSQLFNNSCISCHSSQNKVYPINAIGTSANRLDSIRPVAAGFLGKVHISLCNDPIFCSKPDGKPYVPEEVARKTDGYVAGPLDGIWARAPYLHNGSVPTLYALLTGDRPKQFYRGNIQYDQRLVGFKWDKAGEDSVLYDTELSGNSNQGHSGESFLGFDSKKEPQKVWDLIEYLKTL